MCTHKSPNTFSDPLFNLFFVHRKVCKNVELVWTKLFIKLMNELWTSFRTHTMLGPNPRKAATPSTATPSSSGSDSNKTGDGLMVKAINDIFKFVETSENPDEFRVSFMYNESICDNIRRGSIRMKIDVKIVYALRLFINSQHGIGGRCSALLTQSTKRRKKCLWS